jgi:hypothetical protein
LLGLFPGRPGRPWVQAVAGVPGHDGQQPVKLGDDFRVRDRGQPDTVPFGRGDALACDDQEVHPASASSARSQQLASTAADAASESATSCGSAVEVG